MTSRVAPRDVQGGGVAIDRHDLTLALEGERDGDRAGAGTGVDDEPVGQGRQQLESPLDQRLGVRPRHQHVGADLEVVRPELAHAGKVSERLSAEPALEQIGEGRELGGTERGVGPGVQRSARAARRVAQQELGLDRGLGGHRLDDALVDDARANDAFADDGPKPLGGVRSPCGDAGRCAFAFFRRRPPAVRGRNRLRRSGLLRSRRWRRLQSPISASSSAWCSATSGSITSSSAPARTSSSL